MRNRYLQSHHLLLATIISIFALCMLVSCSDDSQEPELNDNQQHQLYNNPEKPYSYQIQGLTIHNPFYWLLESDSEATKNWLNQQSKQTEQYFLPLKKQSKKLELGTVSNIQNTSAIKHHYFYTNQKFSEFKNEWSLGHFNSLTQKVYEYPLGLTQKQKVTDLKVSTSGRYIAIQISTPTTTDFFGQLKSQFQWSIFDIANQNWTNRTFPATPEKTSFIWLDAQKFIYETPSRTKVLLANIQKDKRFDLTLIALKEDTIKNVALLASNEQLIVTTENDAKTSIVLAELKTIPSKTNVLVNKVAFQLNFIASDNNTLFFITDWAAPRKRIVSIDTTKPAKKYWREVITEKKSTLQDATLINNQWLLHYTNNTTNVLTSSTFNGRTSKEVFRDNAKSITINSHSKNKPLIEISSVSGSTLPLAIDIKNNSLSSVFPQELNTQLNIVNAKNNSKIFFYKNQKGTKIPITLISKNKITEKVQPTLLISHSLNGNNFQYRYNPLFRAFIEKGGRLAVAHTRGDNSYGDSWEKAGQQYKMNNVIDDLVSAQRWIIEHEYSSKNKLGAYTTAGNSIAFAGTLKHKNYFKAVVFNHGVYDLLLPQNINQLKLSEKQKELKQENLEQLEKINPRSNLNRARLPAILFDSQNKQNFPYVAELQNIQRANNLILLRTLGDENKENQLKQNLLFYLQELNF